MSFSRTQQIRQALAARRVELGAELLDTPSGDYATYRYVVGIARGLDEALHIINKVMKDPDE